MDSHPFDFLKWFHANYEPTTDKNDFVQFKRIYIKFQLSPYYESVAKDYKTACFTLRKCLLFRLLSDKKLKEEFFKPILYRGQIQGENREYHKVFIKHRLREVPLDVNLFHDYSEGEMFKTWFNERFECTNDKDDLIRVEWLRGHFTLWNNPFYVKASMKEIKKFIIKNFETFEFCNKKNAVLVGYRPKESNTA